MYGYKSVSGVNTEITSQYPRLSGAYAAQNSELINVTDNFDGACDGYKSCDSVKTLISNDIRIWSV